MIETSQESDRIINYTTTTSTTTTITRKTSKVNITSRVISKYFTIEYLAMQCPL